MTLKHWLLFILLGMFFFAAVFGAISTMQILMILTLGIIAAGITGFITSSKFVNWRMQK